LIDAYLEVKKAGLTPAFIHYGNKLFLSKASPASN